MKQVPLGVQSLPSDRKRAEIVINRGSERSFPALIWLCTCSEASANDVPSAARRERISCQFAGKLDFLFHVRVDVALLLIFDGNQPAVIHFVQLVHDGGNLGDAAAD